MSALPPESGHRDSVAKGPLYPRKRTLLPHPVYQRMQTERQREAAEFRAQDSQKSQEIRTGADRDGRTLAHRLKTDPRSLAKDGLTGAGV